MKAPRTWIVLADASRARILRHLPDHQESDGKHDEIQLYSEHRRRGEIMADKAGRSFASEGTRRSAMEYRSDPVREEERAFAKRIARLLEERRLEDDFDRLVIFAAPRTLGDLRDAMEEGVRKLTIAEIDKDLTRLAGKALRDEIEREAPNLWI
jgi:protein required for attachment to host cells